MSINKSFSRLSKSHKSVEYETPKDFFDKLNSIFHFELDPCTSPDNPLGTKYYFTNESPGFDGLVQEWSVNTFINPPFGRNIADWIHKMKMSYDSYNKDYVMLLPARVDTEWFQTKIWERCPFKDQFIYFVKGRLKFKNAEHNPKNQPHNIGTMLWILLQNTPVNQKERYSKLKILEKYIPGILIDWRNKRYD